MTRKDYIKIADIIKGINNLPEHFSNEDVRDYIIEEMSTMFKLDNRRFDKVKFVDYINN
tara:strand:+ start:1041 stop:1217 length:177 start_codon:yes stop_codon:yes gene_type:complete